MSLQVFSMTIYGILAGLAFLAAQSLTYRLLFVHRRLVPCDLTLIRRLRDQLVGKDLDQTIDLASLTTGKEPWWTGQWGWLDSIRHVRTGQELLTMIGERYREANGHILFLVLISTIATMIGLMGTVAGFYWSDDAGNVALNVAMGSTFWGIAVALIPSSYLILTTHAREELEDQYYRLTEVLVNPAPSNRSTTYRVDSPHSILLQRRIARQARSGSSRGAVPPVVQQTPASVKTRRAEQ